jgi:hypothetical protein
VESLLEKDGVQIEEENVRGVDVGTGASAIFALLFTSRHPKWDMFGTDITEEAVESARRNCLAAGASERCCKDDETTEQVVAADNNNTHSNCSSGRSRRWISIRDVAKKGAAASLAKKKPKKPKRKKTNPSSTSTSSRKSASISPCAIHHSSTPCPNPPKIREQILEARRKRTVTEVANRVSSGE